jgi:hypothetical protein
LFSSERLHASNDLTETKRKIKKKYIKQHLAEVDKKIALQQTLTQILHYVKLTNYKSKNLSIVGLIFGRAIVIRNGKSVFWPNKIFECYWAQGL